MTHPSPHPSPKGKAERARIRDPSMSIHLHCLGYHFMLGNISYPPRDTDDMVGNVVFLFIDDISIDIPRGQSCTSVQYVTVLGINEQKIIKH